MQKPGSKAKDIYAIMKGFDQGDAQGCLFHFTTLKSGRAIVDSGYIRQTSGPFSFLFGGTGVYAGTTPTPSFLLKHASPFGWGLGHTPVRIPIVYKELGVETRLPRGILPPLKTRIITATDGKLNLIR